MKTTFIDTKFLDSIAGVMLSWPHQILSVRLARAIHHSDYTSWREILDDPDGFEDLRGVGKGAQREVTELFASIGIEFDA